MSQFCFGVDVGGTSIKMGLFDMEGNLLDKWEIPTRTEEKGCKIIPDIAKAVQDKMQEKSMKRDEIAGVGLGVPGPVDSKGVVHRAVNLGWDVIPVKEMLSGLLEMYVEVGNDANVAALGEMWKGGGVGHKDLVAVTLGTGVGGGIIVNGRVVTGATGAGGEIGHIHVEDHETQACNCGNKGCLEQYASATGIVKLANAMLSETTKDSILRNQEITAKSVFDAVKAKDQLAMDIAEQFGQYLGKGLAAIAGVVNPEIFVIGGGVSKAGQIVLDYIEKYYKIYVFHGSANAIFALATLGNDAGIFGAAKSVL